MPRLVCVAPVLPGPAIAQDDITRVIGPLVDPDGQRSALLRRVHGSTRVRTRHLALPLDRYPDLRDFGASNDLHRTVGTQLAARACRAALDEAGLAPQAVDVLVLMSVTGVAAPSLDALLVEELGLRRDVRRTPSFGLGCAGGAAGLARVDDVLRGRPGAVALLVCVELCSLTLQHGDASGANVVASGLFGDGAAAAVLVGDDHPAPGVELVGSRSTIHPGTSDELGWEIGASGFRIVLGADLPDIVEAGVRGDVEDLLAAHGLTVTDVATWVVHAGGPRILDSVAKALDLPADALDLSWVSLAEAGNLSSVSVLDVLHRTMAAGTTRPGSTAVVLAFGPGVSTEAVLLRVPGAA